MSRIRVTMGPNVGAFASTSEKNSVSMLSSVAVSERSPRDARTAFIFSLCVGEMRVFGHLNVRSGFTAFKNLKENSLHATQDFY